MERFLQYFLPIYWVLFISIVFIWRGYVVWRRTGVNAFRSLNHTGPHGIVVLYNKIIPPFTTVSMLVYCFAPRYYIYFAPFHWLEFNVLQFLGVAILIVCLWLTWFSQKSMGDAWRIKPDDGNSLLTAGIFSLSRNPIFLGIRMSMIGVFLIMPNGIVLAAFSAGWVLLDVQVALEEEYLQKKYGEVYQSYCRQVRRWL